MRSKLRSQEGQQRSNFPKIGLFSQKLAIISIAMQESCIVSILQSILQQDNKISKYAKMIVLDLSYQPVPSG